MHRAVRISPMRRLYLVLPSIHGCPEFQRGGLLRLIQGIPREDFVYPMQAGAHETWDAGRYITRKTLSRMLEAQEDYIAGEGNVGVEHPPHHVAHEQEAVSSSV
jgi:hypothetical protein